MPEEKEIFFDDMWGELLRGKADSKHAFRYVTLTTIGAENWPSTRTVVLRDVDKETQSLYFFTDKRSTKIKEIESNNKVSLLFYNHKKKLQLRVSGKAVLHTDNKISEQYFEHVRQTDLKDYRTINPPGTALSNGKPEYYNKEKAAEHFMVIQIKAKKIDYLKLDREAHQRILFELNQENWQSTTLVP